MPIQLAPEQGWGLSWNAAHPDQPFTPIIISAPVGSSLPGASSASIQNAPAPSAAVSSDPSTPNAVQSAVVPVPGSETSAVQTSTAGSGHAGDQGATDVSASADATYWHVIASVSNETGQGPVNADSTDGAVMADLTDVPNWFIA